MFLRKLSIRLKTVLQHLALVELLDPFCRECRFAACLPYGTEKSFDLHDDVCRHRRTRRLPPCQKIMVASLVLSRCANPLASRASSSICLRWVMSKIEVWLIRKVWAESVIAEAFRSTGRIVPSLRNHIELDVPQPAAFLETGESLLEDFQALGRNQVAENVFLPMISSREYPSQESSVSFMRNDGPVGVDRVVSARRLVVKILDFPPRLWLVSSSALLFMIAKDVVSARFEMKASSSSVKACLAKHGQHAGRIAGRIMELVAGKTTPGQGSRPTRDCEREDRSSHGSSGTSWS